MTRRLPAWTASAIAAMLAASAAQEQPAPAAAADLLVPAGDAPAVDGRIDEQEWRSAAAFDVLRAGEAFGRARLLRAGRQLHVAYESSVLPMGIGVRIDVTDPVSGRSNLLLVTPVSPPQLPVVPFRNLVGREAERLSAADCDIRFDFKRDQGFSFELRVPLDTLEIAPTEKGYGFTFEVWSLADQRAIASWPQEPRAATVMSSPAMMRSEGAWGAAEESRPAPPRSEGLAFLEDVDKPTDDGPMFRSSAGWISGKRKEAPLKAFEERAARIAAACPDLISVHAILVQSRLARNDLAGALEALDAWDRALPELARTERQALVRMQLLCGLLRYDDAARVLEARAKELEGAAVIARERVVVDGLREAWRLEQELRKAEAQRDDLPRVLLKTSKGEIVIELFEDDANNGVANFVSLVESGFYDGTRFHWAEGAGSVIGGDPNSKDDDPHNDGFGGPGYMIESEPGRRAIFPMTVGYTDSRRQRRTEGSAFAIHLAAAPAEDGVNTVFGRVISGEDVVRKLEHYDTLEKASILRKRPHPYTPVKRVLGTR